MLKQRIITALLMLVVFLFVTFHPSAQIFSAFTLALMVLAAWEWAQLNQCSSRAAIMVGGLFGLLSLGTWYLGWVYAHVPWLWVAVGSVWVLLAAYLLHAGASAWLAAPRFVRLLGGLLLLWVAWLAVIQIRAMGLNFLFSVLVLVWGADIFAYAAGRVFAGRLFRYKLAPSISPGKTWEGVCGAMLGVLVLAFAWRACESAFFVSSGDFYGSLYNRLAFVAPTFMVLAILFLVTMGIVGDLLESLFKRAAGVKDSSALLPGHGGVLDRIDALLPVLPLVMMLLSLL